MFSHGAVGFQLITPLFFGSFILYDLRLISGCPPSAVVMINPHSCLVSEGRTAFGYTSSGAPVYAPFRPTALYLANALNQMEASRPDPNLHMPLPEGLRLSHSASNQQTHLIVEEVYANRHRRIFCYVGRSRFPHLVGEQWFAFSPGETFSRMQWC